MNRLALRMAMGLNLVRHWRPIAQRARHPDDTQRQTLLRILRGNRQTSFGIDHGFQDVSDTRSFQRNVPVQEYETLRPYIEQQRTTGRPALTVDPPLFYAQTSGSTAAPKLIPVTATGLDMHKREQALFSALQFKACPAAFEGSAWGVMGAAVEGRLESGHQVGSVSGHLYQSLPRVVQSRFVVPPIVSTIADYDVKYRTILCLALADGNITYLGSPNPSTFLRLLALMRTDRERLAEVVGTGRLELIDGLPENVRSTLRLRPNPEQARAVRALTTLTYATVWPHIRLVTTWTGGSCGIAVEALRRELPPTALVMELGYQATECRGTMALEPGTSAGLPVLQHHFFEFVEQKAWDAGGRDYLTLSELKPGTTYYVIVTTAGGLYRYFMNDLLEVTGFFERTPLLRFLQKGKGVTSLTGEKLYESQAIDAVLQGARHLAVDPTFFLVIADEQRNSYELLIELDHLTVDLRRLATTIDAELGRTNVEYQAKRESGRLGPLTLTRLKRGAAAAHKAAYMASGQREAQFKPVILQYRRDLRWCADGYIIP